MPCKTSRADTTLRAVRAASAAAITRASSLFWFSFIPLPAVSKTIFGACLIGLAFAGRLVAAAGSWLPARWPARERVAPVRQAEYWQGSRIVLITANSRIATVSENRRRDRLFDQRPLTSGESVRAMSWLSLAVIRFGHGRWRALANLDERPRTPANGFEDRGRHQSSFIPSLAYPYFGCQAAKPGSPATKLGRAAGDH